MTDHPDQTAARPPPHPVTAAHPHREDQHVIAVLAFVAVVILTAGMPLAAPAVRRRISRSWAPGPIHARFRTRKDTTT
jgi:hypothetical protein